MSDEARLPQRPSRAVTGSKCAYAVPAEERERASRSPGTSTNVIRFESDQMPLEHAVARPEFTFPDRPLHAIPALEREPV